MFLFALSVHSLAACLLLRISCFFVIKQKNMQNAANFKKPLHLCCHGFPCFECETFLHVLHGKQHDKQVQGGSVLTIEPGTLCVSQKPKKRCV